MSKKRILSLLLSVLMLVTIVLPIGAFAEENVQEGYEEPVYEEPVDEEPADEEPAYEEPAYEEPVYDEPVDDEPVDEELPVVNFEQEEELVEVASIDEPVVVAAAAITITVQPTSKTVAPGDTAQFGLAAKGTGLTYQWQVQLAGKTTWQDTTLDGNKTKLLSFTALTDYNGRKYRCVITDSNGNTATTNAATLTVGTPITITVQPTSKTVAPGDTAQFGLAAEGTGLTYQWQVQLAGKTTWQDTTLDGNKTKLLSFTALTDYNGRKYRCVVTDSNGNTATTNAATLTVSTSEFIYEDITSTTCRLVKYNGSSTNVSVPQTYNGKTVTEIGPDAFLNNTTLTSIVLPNTITVIGARAFKGCTKLSSMSSVS